MTAEMSERISIVCACGSVIDVPPIPLRCECGVTLGGSTPRVDIILHDEGGQFALRYEFIERGDWRGIDPSSAMLDGARLKG